jgi:hypothetical protein
MSRRAVQSMNGGATSATVSAVTSATAMNVRKVRNARPVGAFAA